MPRRAFPAQIIRAHLIHIEGGQIQWRMVITAIPAVAVQQAVDNMLSVGVLAVDRHHRREFRAHELGQLDPLDGNFVVAEFTQLQHAGNLNMFHLGIQEMAFAVGLGKRNRSHPD